MKLDFSFLPLFAFLLIPASVLAYDQHAHKTGRSPIVLAEINNNGEVGLLLTVYSDGEAILARRDNDEPDGEICSTSMPAAALETLESTLRDAGALHLQDVAPVPGITRKTVSFFIGPEHPARIHGNSFSYSRAEGPYLSVAGALNAVITNHFGDCI